MNKKSVWTVVLVLVSLISLSSQGTEVAVPPPQYLYRYDGTQIHNLPVGESLAADLAGRPYAQRNILDNTIQRVNSGETFYLSQAAHDIFQDYVDGRNEGATAENSIAADSAYIRRDTSGRVEVFTPGFTRFGIEFTSGTWEESSEDRQRLDNLDTIVISSLPPSADPGVNTYC